MKHSSTESSPSRRRNRWVAAALVVVLVAAAAAIGAERLHHGHDLPAVVQVQTHAIALAEYPEMAAYPNENDFWNADGTFDDEGFTKVYDAWRQYKQAQTEQPEGYDEGYDGFCAASLGQFLDGDGENRVYSPLNVYLALGMLAELTDGESRQQVLDLLACDSIDTLRQRASSLWNANYSNDGAVTSILGSSLWLRDDITYVPETLERLAETYYASSYAGEMGSEKFNETLRSWLNSQTGGLLEDQAAGLSLSPDTILALATTIQFRAKWGYEFSEKNTAPGTFHSSGGDVTCDFLHRSGANTYYWADQFSAISRSLRESGRMWFLLPDEGVDVNALLRDPQALELLLNGGETWANQKRLIVNEAIPKFDVVSQLNLIDGLKALGVTDVFDEAVSDFSPMTTNADGIFVSQVRHDARVAIDEEGVTAVAYTVMSADASDMPPDEEVDFTVDRPFLFGITSRTGQLLFVGLVQNPI